jgi:regulatory protein
MDRDAGAMDREDGPEASGEAASRILESVVERPGAVTIRLDGGETLEVAPDAVPADLPAAGGSLGSPLVASLRRAAARKQAARQLFALLDRSLQSRARLRRKLLDGGHPEDAVDAVLDQAEAAGLHSDRRYAEAYCRDVWRRKPVGAFWVESKLREKGVPAALAAEVVRAHLSPRDERALAEDAAAARWRRESGRDRRALARVQRFLASRGFPAALCREAAARTRPADPKADAPCNSGPEDPS